MTSVTASDGRGRQHSSEMNTNAGSTPNVELRGDTEGTQAARLREREDSTRDSESTRHRNVCPEKNSSGGYIHIDTGCRTGVDVLGDTYYDTGNIKVTSTPRRDYRKDGNVCVGKENVKRTGVENSDRSAKRVNERLGETGGGAINARGDITGASSHRGPNSSHLSSVLDTSDLSDYGSLCTGSLTSLGTVTGSQCEDPGGPLLRTSTCDEDDDVFVTSGRTDRRSGGSPVSDCTEDSGIEAEEGDMKARLLRNAGPRSGAFQPVNLGNGITVHKAGSGMLLKSVQDGESGANGGKPAFPLETNNNVINDHVTGDSPVTMGETIYKTDNMSEDVHLSATTETPVQERRAQAPITPHKRPPHIIPPEVRRIMRVTSQSAPSSPLGRRRVQSEYIPHSPCMSPFRTPPPSFPAPPSPAASRLLAGHVPPPCERRRPRRNRLSWDPSRSDFSFDLDSPWSSRSSTPNPQYLDGDLRFNLRGHPHGTRGTSPEGSTKGSGSSGSDTSGEVASVLRNPPRLTLNLAAASAAGVGSETNSVTSSPRSRRRVVSCSSPRPHLNAPPSPGFSPSVRPRPRVRSRASQALTPHKPVIRSKSADRALHLPGDHRLQTKPCNPNDVLQKASKLQLDLLKSKKVIERTLSERLEEDMEKQDELSSAIKRSMKEPRTKDQVKAANRKVKKVIHSDVVEDPETLTKYYKVEVDLGNYTNDVSSKVIMQTVKITGTTPDVPKYTKELTIEFPDTVNMERIDILQIGQKMILGVPFKSSARRKPSLTEVLEPEGDPNDPMQRISFLEGLFRSLKLPWPPEGATAHYEYLTGRFMGDENITSGNINYDYIFADDVKRTFHQDSAEEQHSADINCVNNSSPNVQGQSGKPGSQDQVTEVSSGVTTSESFQNGCKGSALNNDIQIAQ